MHTFTVRNSVTHKTNAFQVDFEWGWGYVILSDRQTVKAIFFSY